MKIKFTAQHLVGEEKEQIEALTAERIGTALSRLEQHVRSVRVTLRDLNGPRGGRDKLCILRVELQPFGMLLLSHEGNSYAEAISCAADRLQQAMLRKIQRRESNRRKLAREAEIKQVA